MKKICGIAVIAAFVVVSSMNCAADVEECIPNGVYREPAKIESVVAAGAELTFNIEVASGQTRSLVERKYKYSISDGGKIRVVGSSNDTGLVFGVLRYDWFWSGKTIIRKEPKSGNTVIYTLEVSVPK